MNIFLVVKGASLKSTWNCAPPPAMVIQTAIANCLLSGDACFIALVFCASSIFVCSTFSYVTVWLLQQPSSIGKSDRVAQMNKRFFGGAPSKNLQNCVFDNKHSIGRNIEKSKHWPPLRHAAQASHSLEMPQFLFIYSVHLGLWWGITAKGKVNMIYDEFTASEAMKHLQPIMISSCLVIVS